MLEVGDVPDWLRHSEREPRLKPAVHLTLGRDPAYPDNAYPGESSIS